MNLLAVTLVLAQEAADVAEEGKHIVIGMLLTGLVFVGVILLGQLARYLGTRRRKQRRHAGRAY
jgi:hypothetical protein